jgi:DNA-binding NtrC family response regulator
MASFVSRWSVPPDGFSAEGTRMTIKSRAAGIASRKIFMTCNLRKTRLKPISFGYDNSCTMAVHKLFWSFSMWFRKSERTFTQAVVAWGFANPFDADAIARQEQAAFRVDLPDEVRNRKVPRRTVAWGGDASELLRNAEALAEVIRDRARFETGSECDRELYRDLALFVVYFRFRNQLQGTLEASMQRSPGKDSRGGPRADYYPDFSRDLGYYYDPVNAIDASERSLAHWFAAFFQIRRAFALIHLRILGKSRAIARLRAMVWQSIFTHDMRRYRDLLYDRMHDVATLIVGPSGTGKDLVAECIGLSRHVGFDPRTRQFEEDIGGAFHAVNLSALSPQLIESELFGHCQGAFTGAMKDRVGWLESCRRCHSVFLDEIGELDPAIQVKLLRVLQNRTLQRMGETQQRRFEGKVIAATHRDLGELIARGTFRRDFYYRLCSDMISTPTLAEQLGDAPDELPHLVGFLARRMFGDEGTEVAGEVTRWIDANLGADYTWPGNMRELEQCIRNVVVRGVYNPLRENETTGTERFLSRIAEVDVTADELLTWYCAKAHAKAGSYAAAASRLGMDRRTLRSRLGKDVPG